MSLPELFIKKMSHLLGRESEAFFKTYDQKRAFGLRANLLKITADQLKNIPGFHLQPIPFCSAGFYYTESDEPGKHPFHQAGLYYIQEPSAMFVADTLDAKPGERVLDLCAAPGGKSTQIAVSMHNQGLLVSNEIYPKRAKVLSENMERMGITNALVTNETSEHLADYFPGNFDKILVDAPCSGEGMFRKDPDAMRYWSPDHVRACATLQSQILDHAYSMLREEGILVYSTCTFSPEEDERAIEQFLEKYPDLELLPVEKTGGITDGQPQWADPVNPELSKTARLWPHHLNGEGHFVAKLQKHGTAPTRKIRLMPSEKETLLKDYRTFEHQALTEKLSGVFHFMGNQLFLLPENCPDFSKLKVIRAGLHLGEQKKNRFEPNHALALALPARCFQSVFPLDAAGSDWDPYLRGETLSSPTTLKGWTAVLIDGFPLGWGKVSSGTLKNFYPKGLRRRGLKH